jgi:ABC-2 type transport system ATP-binding protein
LGADVIEVSELTKRFGKFLAVDHVTFRVAKGEIFGFLGPNGAGKSTTIRMLCGILASTSGTARVVGFDINRQSGRVRENIGYMSQKFSLYQDLTVEENLRFYGGIYGLAGETLAERMRRVLERAGLQGSEARLAGELAGGWQQRLALGCAILHEPPVVFLDEPTAGVDPISRRNFWDLIYEMADGGTTVFVTTHFMDEAEYCHRLAFIQAGRIIAMDTPRNMRKGMLRETLLELAAEPVVGIAEAVKGLPGVRSVSFFGERLHLFVDPERSEISGLVKAIEARRFRVKSLKPVEVSLEDVFIRLTQQQREGVRNNGA